MIWPGLYLNLKRDLLASDCDVRDGMICLNTLMSERTTVLQLENCSRTILMPDIITKG